MRFNPFPFIGGLLAFAVVALFVGWMFASEVSNASDEQALHYKGGVIQSKKYASYIGPSDRAWDGPGDKHYQYPAGDRTYSFTGRKGSESGPVSVKTSDSQEMSVKGFITFELTDDPKKLRAFHENVGSKYEAWIGGDDDRGFGNFLNDYMAVPLNSVMDKAGLQSGWQALYSNPETLAAFEDKVKSDLPGEIANALGDDYLTVKSVSIETPVPPKRLRDSLEASQKAILDQKTQINENATRKTGYETFTECKKVLSEANCVLLEAVKSGKVTVLPVPQGSDLNVTPNGRN